MLTTLYHFVLRSLEGGTTPRRDLEKILSGKDKNSRPGMPGFVQRARVPQPSKKDYVIRPKWNVEEKPSKVGQCPSPHLFLLVLADLPGLHFPSQPPFLFLFTEGPLYCSSAMFPFARLV